MKILLFISFVLITGLFAREKRAKLFPFKSAKITYKYEASFTGTHLKYIDDYGYKQADYIIKAANFGGRADAEKETVILIGPKAYTFNYQDSTVAVGRNVTYGYYVSNPGRTGSEISEAILKASGGWKITGTEKFLDKNCQVWKSGKNTKLTWQGLELKSTINFMTMMVEKAAKIEIDIDIPQSKFEIPQGFRYISADVYQGFSGLKLQFDSTEIQPRQKEGHLKFSFNSADLGGCNNFVYFADKGKEVNSKGVNDYNKIDNVIIKSQEYILSNETLELPPAQTLIFKTGDGLLGKMQIKQVNKAGWEARFVVFNGDGTINTYSDGSNDFLKNDFIIAADEHNYKLIITPKNKAKCFVPGW